MEGVLKFHSRTLTWPRGDELAADGAAIIPAAQGDSMQKARRIVCPRRNGQPRRVVLEPVGFAGRISGPVGYRRIHLTQPVRKSYVGCNSGIGRREIAARSVGVVEIHLGQNCSS